MGIIGWPEPSSPWRRLLPACTEGAVILGGDLGWLPSRGRARDPTAAATLRVVLVV